MNGPSAAEAAPLYRAEDADYQFKYFPAFAMAMRPVAVHCCNCAASGMTPACGSRRPRNARLETPRTTPLPSS